MALFVVLEDFQGPGSLHLQENAVIDDALYDFRVLLAAGLVVVAATPELLESINAGSGASNAQTSENAENTPDKLVFNRDGEIVYDTNGDAFTVV